MLCRDTKACAAASHGRGEGLGDFSAWGGGLVDSLLPELLPIQSSVYVCMYVRMYVRTYAGR